MKKLTVILGASDKPERYSYKALKKLLAHGHPVRLVHPRLKQIEEEKVYSSLQQIEEAVHTLTVYVGQEAILAQIPNIVALKPERVILNPGTESDALKKALDENKISYIEACTLVMLSTGQF